MLETDFDIVAQTFVDARLNSQVVAEYPGVLPEDFSAAYDIQDDAIRLFAKPVGGWKVGRVGDSLVEKYGANRLVGPVFADMIVHVVDGEVAEMPALAGFAAVEAELMLRVCKTPPVNVDISSITEYIDEVRFGLEIASSPFPGINDHGPAVTISDFGNNFGLVLGPIIENWKDRDLINAPVELHVDGAPTGTGKLATMLDGPFGAAAFLANLLARRGIELTPGTWISTGAITGVHQIQPGQSAHARFDGEFEVACDTRLFAPNGSVA
jgi:2-keto-4-pentenoate hydratase